MLTISGIQPDSWFLTVTGYGADARLLLSAEWDASENAPGCIVTFEVREYRDLAITNGATIQCSSTLDFPEEHGNPFITDLCRRIRS